MDVSATRLGHVCYELKMLRYSYGKLLEVEKAIALDPSARQKAGPFINVLIEAFCIHARNLDEFFQGTGDRDTLRARKFADSFYRPLPRDDERKRIIKKIHKQIAHLSKKRTSAPAEKIDIEDRAQLSSILAAEADNFTRHLLPELQPAWPCMC
jgi:hypothetical protein